MLSNMLSNMLSGTNTYLGSEYLARDDAKRVNIYGLGERRPL
jgi:hypothetical protein